jgi:hypothetical protein
MELIDLNGALDAKRSFKIDLDEATQQQEGDDQPNPLHSGPKRASLLSHAKKRTSSTRGRRGSNKSTRRTMQHRRSIHTQSQSVTEKWDPLVFLIIWLSWLLLPISVGIHFLRLCEKRYSRYNDGALWGKGQASRKKRERNLCLVVECVCFILLSTNLLLYTCRYPHIDLSVEVFLPPAIYVLIAGIHAADQATISRKDEALSLAHFVYRRSLLQTLWVTPLQLDAATIGNSASKHELHSPVAAQEAAGAADAAGRIASAGAGGVIASDMQQKLLLSKFSKQAQRQKVTQDLEQWCKNESLDRLYMSVDPMTQPSVQSLALSRKNDYHLGFVTSGAQSFTAEELAKEVWGMTLGLKRWASFRRITFTLALVHGLLPLLYRVLYKYAYGGGQHPVTQGQLYWERSEEGEYSDVCVAVWIGVTSAILSFSFMLLVARLLHKCMMDYTRRWQVTRYITGLFDRDDSDWAGLPYINITSPNGNTDTGPSSSALESGSGSSSMIHGGSLHVFDNIVGWVAVRRCLLVHVERVTQRNYTYVTSILLLVTALIVYELLSLLFAKAGAAVKLDTLKCLIIFYTFTLSSYFVRILEFVAASNALQRHHISALQDAQYTLSKRCWYKPDGDKWHRLYNPNTAADSKEDAEREQDISEVGLWCASLCFTVLLCLPLLIRLLSFSC